VHAFGDGAVLGLDAGDIGPDCFERGHGDFVGKGIPEAAGPP
jgi:hypothetical protein